MLTAYLSALHAVKLGFRDDLLRVVSQHDRRIESQDRFGEIRCLCHWTAVDG